MTEPLISIRQLRREFPAGAETITVLRDIDLEIRHGEMVAIIGQSGSGKSTLMNVLGCLDNGWTGEYRLGGRLGGRDVSRLKPDELAELRRAHFGFIFQRYQLLADLDALENVEVPAIYAGARKEARRERAHALLERLGLGERMTHRPNALSGGQQQRVSVARALVNGGEIILADEPTGALDSKSGKELMALLKELNAEGHTIIIVTHDPAIAAQVDRVVEISDGVIIADRRRDGAGGRVQKAVEAITRIPHWREGLDRLGEAFQMALRALSSHRLRTFLTMLGIIIGIASVVSVVALGTGSQQAVLDRISSIGTNTINITPGANAADRRRDAIRTLVPADAAALAAEDYADSVTPQVTSNGQARYRNISASAQMVGVGPDYFRVNNRSFVDGAAFDAAGVTSLAQVAVIDTTARDTLFTSGEEPVGQVILVGNVPLRIIGVVAASTNNFGPQSGALSIWMPYTTAMSRILGQGWLSTITVRVADSADVTDAQGRIATLLEQRHGTLDFSLQNTDTIRETIQSTSQTLTLLISAIAVISLIVGGIGVMNIMLVSVRERTREIGVRMAVGARQGDILQQFLIEAVLVCLIGGTIGVLLSFGIGFSVGQLVSGLSFIYSPSTIIAAFISSSLIGVAFGFMPARSAARLDPVVALASE
ncbi:MAG: macrolide transporter permease/ATP-binding protein MacB [Devosia sp.]|uniref:MacB family efflux pump subunit n=1 Tax=Devosia sp. TaxID=1871048 RepID=UPI00262FC230|nr:MacB family efflux pump subunit [Devosia sp.]MDB5542706.1 macrolide transporter permease/ATP-binding protein MacB [Devosia sp.]